MTATTQTILITGNTYPVKDAIKALGGRWDAIAKGWRVPADVASKAQALVSGAPKSAPPREQRLQSRSLRPRSPQRHRRLRLQILPQRVRMHVR